jgi:hypothetical protein
MGAFGGGLRLAFAFEFKKAYVAPQSDGVCQ